MSSLSATPSTASTPTVVSLPGAALWLVGTALLAVLAYYFIGVDQGMVSVFGSDTHIHELVHDARHLLGFPCH
jgi:hypothetical protein